MAITLTYKERALRLRTALQLARDIRTVERTLIKEGADMENIESTLVNMLADLAALIGSASGGVTFVHRVVIGVDPKNGYEFAFLDASDDDSKLRISPNGAISGSESHGIRVDPFSGVFQASDKVIISSPENGDYAGQHVVSVTNVDTGSITFTAAVATTNNTEDTTVKLILQER